MPRESIQEILDAAPAFGPAQAKELNDLLHRYSCIPAFLNNILIEAGQMAMDFSNMDFSDERARYQATKVQGAIQGMTAIVGNLIGKMVEGDAVAEKVEAEASLVRRRVRPRTEQAPPRRPRTATKSARSTKKGRK